MTAGDAEGGEAPRLDDLLDRLPPDWPEDVLPRIQQAVAPSRQAVAAEGYTPGGDSPRGRTVVVLDDDPTGTQTVHDVPVLTDWSVDTLRHALAHDHPLFYLLTNSRSLPPADAVALVATIGRNLREAAGDSDDDSFVVISRGDSTLRGHFPGEVDALVGVLGGVDGILLIPAFIAGGRYTVNDMHYVADGERLVPAGQTDFARDAAFGYRSSHLRAWVEEKTGGRIAAEHVASLSIEDIRSGGPERVTARLMALQRGGVCIVNAASERDLAVVALGAIEAEARGRRLLYRTAASFVPLRAGLAPRSLLTPTDLNLPERGGGLVVVGSYVSKTSGQLAALLEQPGVVGIEADVATLLAAGRQEAEVSRVAQLAEHGLSRGDDAVIYTSRRLVAGTDARDALAIGQCVSQSLVAIVRTIGVRPRYLLAKGGITSSDLATRGLGVRRALVLGQLMPGVPVWRLGAESRYPGLVYVVFPGNVGGPLALAEAVAALHAPAQE